MTTSAHHGGAADEPSFWAADAGIDQNGAVGLATGSPRDCFICLDTRQDEVTVFRRAPIGTRRSSKSDTMAHEEMLPVVLRRHQVTATARR